MNVAVIGPTGVLGRALVPVLLEKGFAVRALALVPEKVRRLFPQVAEIFQCDLLSISAADLLPMLQGCEAAIHIATAIPRDFTAPHAMDTTNRLRTDGVRKLLDASLKVGVRRYIQQSITMAYPDHGDDWISEELSLDMSPARAEICAPVIRMEQMIRDTPLDRLEWCILRGGTFVGRGTFQDDRIESLRSGNEIVPCDGRNFTSLIHVADMARAVANAIENPPPGSVFNIVDEPIRNGDYLDRLADSIGADRPRRDLSAECPPSWRCSNQAARERLSWQPTHNIIPEP
jgi:nucleoside-diphosphate-sugar epimerase